MVGRPPAASPAACRPAWLGNYVNDKGIEREGLIAHLVFLPLCLATYLSVSVYISVYVYLSICLLLSISLSIYFYTCVCVYLSYPLIMCVCCIFGEYAYM